MNTLRLMVMTELGDFYDKLMGDKFNGHYLAINYNGTLEDIDKNEIELLQRTTEKDNNTFIHRVRMATYI